ncbi:proline/glycine betaine ABC transporter permease [Paenibacillus validus]|uniref:ABC transporter permease subunit n=2 Tax=Paenibacillus validus TaxID=44253 RepID=A0A7X2ZGZ3_9BACL|nr:MULTISPECIES: proline/glycine betaine ABC transporter permease [Paenibacillus]MED4602081.1 proline/glycine betaine ABC transporter permease [Paenibacillus validus]MED4608484.1 proline/glycine betaine ABC transporter permease [Paenibacillus validus]MUG74078.1 ABC transporter permease subunit [Paenibacillus validus]
MTIPKLPLDEWIESIVNGLEDRLSVLFDIFSTVIEGIVDFFSFLFLLPPSLLMVVILAAVAYWFASTSLAVFTLLGLFLIDNLGYWEHTMDTLALVMTSATISIILGVPLGILCARDNKIQNLLTPVLDFMQTMPAFVYLIPAVTFFGLGVVPGVIASVIFAVPPTIRLTNLGIRQVPHDLIEAGEAFGSTPNQKLFKIQLPLAVPSIMAGINQTIMLALSMVVISSMIGAQGIGADVYRAVTQIKTGQGFEAGLCIVILAILLDRLSQHLVKRKQKRRG